MVLYHHVCWGYVGVSMVVDGECASAKIQAPVGGLGCVGVVSFVVGERGVVV
jgi:hypothetical protein